MSHTFAQLTIHAVFSTKKRVPLLKGEHLQRVHGYLATLINDELGMARQVGGTADHVHALFDLKPTVALSDCMRKVKSVSSGWIRGTLPEIWDFAWQPGYGAFSVSASLIRQVKEYVRDQERHHRKRSFTDEFILLLQRHGIEYDPRHLWEEPSWHDDSAGAAP